MSSTPRRKASNSPTSNQMISPSSSSESDDSWIDAAGRLSISGSDSLSSTLLVARGGQGAPEPTGGSFSSSESEDDYGTASIIAARSSDQIRSGRPTEPPTQTHGRPHRLSPLPGQLSQPRTAGRLRGRRADQDMPSISSSGSSSPSIGSREPELDLLGESWASFTATSYPDAPSAFSDTGSRDLTSVASSRARIHGKRSAHDEDDDETSSLSLSSYEDAESEIDNFLADSHSYMSNKENKLRLWQALCLELGLAVLPFSSQNLEELIVIDLNAIEPSPPSSEPATPTAFNFRSPLPAFPSLPDRAATPTFGERAVTPTNSPVELPQTLSGCKKLLKERGHVNLVDYWQARDQVKALREFAKDGNFKDVEMQIRGIYGSLVHPSAASMTRYTLRTRKVANKKVVKSEWLDPLMRKVFY